MAANQIELGLGAIGGGFIVMVGDLAYSAVKDIQEHHTARQLEKVKEKENNMIYKEVVAQIPLVQD